MDPVARPSPPRPPSRPLGRSGLPVTRIGLGLAALGRPGYLNVGHATDLGDDRSVEGLARRCHAVLDAAYDRGVRYVDAARSYGRAEEFLASWLGTRGHPDVVVGSKWGYTYTAGWRPDAEQHEVKDHGLGTLRRQLAETRALLGEGLALYQVHSATLESGVLDNVGVLDALAALRAEGLIVGLSVSGTGQADTVRRALEVERDGRPLFGVVQAAWNLLERSAGPALQEAADAGLGVLVKESLANGRLTGRGSGPATSRTGAVLAAVAEDAGATMDAVAMAAVLARPWADAVLSGAATPEHLDANLAALDVPAAAAQDPRLAELAEPPGSYWATRAALTWT